MNALQQTAPIDLSAVPLAALEQALAVKKKEADKTAKIRRAAYEADKERLVNDLGAQALGLAELLAEFRAQALAKLPAFRERMLEYGDLRGKEKNKGSFELKNDRFKVVFRSHVNKRFDERAELGAQRLKRFLESTVKKRDLPAYQLISSLLVPNEKSGDYDIDLISRLYKMERDFDHPDWLEAIKLFKESYNPTGTAHYASFCVKDARGAWQPLVLDAARAQNPYAAPEAAPAMA